MHLRWNKRADCCLEKWVLRVNLGDWIWVWHAEVGPGAGKVARAWWHRVGEAGHTDCEFPRAFLGRAAGQGPRAGCQQGR
jgi:hypothetical protein